MNLIANRSRPAAALILLAVFAAGSAGLARPAASSATAARSTELPELAGLGPLAIGTTRYDVSAGARSIGVRLWYPARPAKPATKAEVYRHIAYRAGTPPYPITEQGRAASQAPALGGSYPLLVMSHGFGGWDTHMSQLAEALASHGYVIAAIDHRDAAFTDVPGFLGSFGAALVNRADDQRAVLRQLLTGQLGAADVLAETDRTSIGLIGYSMGGYGALTTAGATLDPQAPALAQLPDLARQQALRPDAELAGRIKAVALLAPWGAQPSARAWSDEGLRGLTAPLLLIDGNLDDVADYAQGVQRVFAKAERADRYLLTFVNANHNAAAPIPAPEETYLSKDGRPPGFTHYNDAVWDTVRMNNILDHFATAFFDERLKGDTDKLAYLDVLPNGKDGVFAVDKDGKPTAAHTYWKGFSRRTAVGLVLEHLPAGR